jgi:two-component system response regulator NreC
MARVVIADDSTIHLEGMKIILSGIPEVEVVGVVTDRESVIAVVQESHAEILFLDASFEEEGDGLLLVSEVVKSCPEVSVVTLSYSKSVGYILQSISGGARGYLSKDTTAEEIGRVIKAVELGGGFFLGETIPRLSFERFVKNREEGEGVSLSQRELEVVELLAKGLCSKEIATILGINFNTVESHKEHIKEKMNVKTVVEIVVNAVRMKLIQIS